MKKEGINWQKPATPRFPLLSGGGAVGGRRWDRKAALGLTLFFSLQAFNLSQSDENKHLSEVLIYIFQILKVAHLFVSL